jgi:uncharacterized membrane protein YeiH
LPVTAFDYRAIILIGAVPPGAINDWHYLGVSLAAGIITFYFPSAIMQRRNPVLLFDAAGLALFAVSGAHKALVYGLNPIMAIFAGTFVFALSGAMAGVKRKLDIFGVLVLSFAAANTGGISRDILLGMLTGIGGGMARDVLLAEIPIVLRADLYAVAALAGAAIVVIANMLQLPYGVAGLVGAALCFGLRVMAIHHGWRLPVAGADRRRSRGTDTAADP